MSAVKHVGRLMVWLTYWPSGKWLYIGSWIFVCVSILVVTLLRYQVYSCVWVWVWVPPAVQSHWAAYERARTETKDRVGWHHCPLLRCLLLVVSGTSQTGSLYRERFLSNCARHASNYSGGWETARISRNPMPSALTPRRALSMRILPSSADIKLFKQSLRNGQLLILKTLMRERGKWTTHSRQPGIFHIGLLHI